MLTCLLSRGTPKTLEKMGDDHGHEDPVENVKVFVNHVDSFSGNAISRVRIPSVFSTHSYISHCLEKSAVTFKLINQSINQCISRKN